LGHNHNSYDFSQHSIYNPGSTEYCSSKEGTHIKYLYHDSELFEVSSKETSKGFYIVEVKDNKIDASFIETSSRKVVTVEVEFENATPEEILRGASEALQNHNDENQIIRPLVVGTLAKGYRSFDIRTNEIHKAANGLFVDWPICSVISNSTDVWSTDFEGDYRRIFEDYYSKTGWNKESVKKLSDISLDIMKSLASKSMTKVKSIERVISIIENSTFEEVERVD
jgi:hypothetical protein